MSYPGSPEYFKRMQSLQIGDVVHYWFCEQDKAEGWYCLQAEPMAATVAWIDNQSPPWLTLSIVDHAGNARRRECVRPGLYGTATPLDGRYQLRPTK